MTTESDAAPTTPSSQWRANGEPDPHGKHYDCERAALTLGTLTDDELANEAFLNYDTRLSLEDLLHPKPGRHMPIVWMTAVKERIRWLSRALERALAPASEGQADATQEAYQQYLDDTKDATLPWARRALVTSIAECQALSYSEDRGITVSEAESIGGVLHELRRLQNLEAEAVAVVTASVPAEAVPVCDKVTVARMGYGAVAVGSCLSEETNEPGIIYMALDDVGEIGRDTTDIYPVGSRPSADRVLAYVSFKTAASVDQTIGILEDVKAKYFAAPASSAGDMETGS